MVSLEITNIWITKVSRSTSPARPTPIPRRSFATLGMQVYFPENFYTIVREPFSHTLSQYFHCSESKDHSRPRRINGTMVDRRTLMPSLEAWLEAYSNLKGKNLDRKQMTMRTEELKRRFHCYNAIDSESEYTRFRERNNLPENYTYPYPNTEDHGDRDEETKQFDNMLFDDLKQRFKIIGDMSQMVKTVCAIFIDFTKGKHIPELCDCTNSRDNVNEDSSSTFCVPNLYMHPHGQDKTKWQNSCPIQIGYDSSNRGHAHGVKHHGSTFLKEITQDQRE
jgi:hypothetical protein